MLTKLRFEETGWGEVVLVMLLIDLLVVGLALSPVWLPKVL